MTKLALPYTGGKRRYARFCGAAVWWELWIGDPYMSGSVLTSYWDRDKVLDYEYFKERGMW